MLKNVSRHPPRWRVKEITSLKQANLQTVSRISSFYIGLTSAYFCFTSYHLTNLHCASVTTRQTSLLTVWDRSADTCIPYQVTILRIKPHFVYHDNWSQELISKVIFRFSTLIWRGINYFGYGYTLCVDQCYWFPCKPKHVEAVLLILKCFNNSAFCNVVCISRKLKCWILLMHGVTMKFICWLFQSELSNECNLILPFSCSNISPSFKHIQYLLMTSFSPESC